MLREPQHERNFLNHFKSLSARPELVEGLRDSFSATCYCLLLRHPLHSVPLFVANLHD
jgi:hypothetical protein